MHVYMCDDVLCTTAVRGDAAAPLCLRRKWANDEGAAESGAEFFRLIISRLWRAAHVNTKMRERWRYRRRGKSGREARGRWHFRLAEFNQLRNNVFAARSDILSSLRAPRGQTRNCCSGRSRANRSGTRGLLQRRLHLYAKPFVRLDAIREFFARPRPQTLRVRAS